jgi:hypothetical protein
MNLNMIPGQLCVLSVDFELDLWGVLSHWYRAWFKLHRVCKYMHKRVCVMCSSFLIHSLDDGRCAAMTQI